MTSLTMNWFTAADVLGWLLVALWTVTVFSPGYLTKVCREAWDRAFLTIVALVLTIPPFWRTRRMQARAEAHVRALFIEEFRHQLDRERSR